MSFEGSSVRNLTSRLVARASSRDGAAATPALAVHAACEYTHRALARNVGANGARALLGRALCKAQTQHPVLQRIRIDADEPVLGAVQEIAAAEGTQELEAGLEAVLETLIELLARFVGEDMVLRLVELSDDPDPADRSDVRPGYSGNFGAVPEYQVAATPARRQ